MTANAEQASLATATIKEINDAVDAGSICSEDLVNLFLSRIQSFDQAGPKLNSVILINPHALDRAKELDAERRRSGRRTDLHGIPIVLKDNIDTADMATTAGSFMLEGSLPPDDAAVVRKLRDAGAIVLAKVNMSEFAAGGPISSLGGRTRNPHNVLRSAGGSSGGTAVAIAANFAMAGLGTDTGGSIRVPAAFNGIVGLRPTVGLISRDGIVPMALSRDTVGPMTRNVHDAALVLGVLTGVDPADDATRLSAGKFERDYVKHLDASSFDGARIGVARDYMGKNGEVDWIIETALHSMENAGATLIDVTFPDWFVASQISWTVPLTWWEFRRQIPLYLETLGETYPKDLDDLIELSMTLPAPRDNIVPNPARWKQLAYQHKRSGEIETYKYDAILNYVMPMARFLVESTISTYDLDAIVYPTMPSQAPLTDTDYPTNITSKSAIRIASLTGFPELSIPAGFTSDGMPASISFLGNAFSEPTLLSLGFALEQSLNTYRLPTTTPSLPEERF